MNVFLRGRLRKIQKCALLPFFILIGPTPYIAFASSATRWTASIEQEGDKDSTVQLEAEEKTSLPQATAEKGSKQLYQGRCKKSSAEEAVNSQRKICLFDDNSLIVDSQWVSVDGYQQKSALVIRVHRENSSRILNCTPHSKSQSVHSSSASKLNERDTSWNCLEQPVPAQRTGKGLVSPFESEVAGVNIPNAQIFSGTDLKNGTLLRSMNPQLESDVDEAIQQLAIQRVLVFKNIDKKTILSSERVESVQGLFDEDHQPQDDNFTNELRWLKERNIDVENSEVFKVIPFPYKDIKTYDFKEKCEQAIDGLEFLRTGMESGQSTWLHCTVGEDRTGLLVALYKIFFEKKELHQAFYQDMCQYGYGDGNPQKPDFIVQAIDESLTPFLIEMNRMIKNGDLMSNGRPDKDGCRKFNIGWKKHKIDRFRCDYSTRSFIPLTSE